MLVVPNKVDDANREGLAWEFVGLGLGDPHPVSALHGRGTGDLLDAVVDRLPEAPPDTGDGTSDGSGGPTGATGATGPEEKVFAVALVGRPNVGKSTLFNRLIGEDRAVVHDLPGTTRDAIDTVVETAGGPIRFVDTAGMRRKSRIDEGTEYFSFVRALQAVDAADVALLVIDAPEGVTHQDQRLAERIDAAGCPVVVLLNKWETLDTEERAEVTYQVGRRLAFIGEAVVLKVSALTGKGVHRLVPALADAIEAYHRRVPTRKVNDVLGRRPAAPARSPRGAGPVRHPGGHRPAHLHPVRQQGPAGDVPALPRAVAARGLRPRRHPDQAAGAPAQLRSPTGSGGRSPTTERGETRTIVRQSSHRALQSVTGHH